MNRLKTILTLGMYLAGSSAFAQDKVYCKDSVIHAWKVSEITPESIKGTTTQNTGVVYSTVSSKVLFVFNSIGNFLVVPRLYDNPVKSGVFIKNFLHSLNNTFNESDRIITLQNNIITCNYESENGSEIIYSFDNKKGSIPEKEVAVVILKNGDHKLYADVVRTYMVLSAVQDKYNELSFAPGVSAIEDKGKSGGSAASTYAPVNARPVPRIISDSVNTSVAGGLPDSSPKSSDSSASAVKKADETENGEATFDPASLKKLQQVALLNIESLNIYIQKICSKKSGLDEVAATIDMAMELFVNEDALFEVSSRNRTEVRSYRVRDYLDRLSVLKYDNVKIEWYNIQYASKLHKGPDNNYYGVVEFEQRFTGSKDGKVVYDDITRKTVEVVIKLVNGNRGGKVVAFWDVFLGNIGVTVTKSAN